MNDEVVGPSAYAIKSWRRMQTKRIKPSNATFFKDEKMRYFTKLLTVRGTFIEVLLLLAEESKHLLFPSRP
jgi:hypothetical protein